MNVRFVMAYNVSRRPACGTVMETDSWRPPVAGAIGRVIGLLPSGDVFECYIVCDADWEVKDGR